MRAQGYGENNWTSDKFTVQKVVVVQDLLPALQKVYSRQNYNRQRACQDYSRADMERESGSEFIGYGKVFEKDFCGR